MANNIVQLQDKSGDNIYPISGGTVQGAVTKGMLAEGVFEGPELSEPTDVAYVRTANIVDGAVTSDKIDFATLETESVPATDYVSVASGYTINTLSARRFGPLVQIYFDINGSINAGQTVIGSSTSKWLESVHGAGRSNLTGTAALRPIDTQLLANGGQWRIFSDYNGTGGISGTITGFAAS